MTYTITNDNLIVCYGGHSGGVVITDRTPSGRPLTGQHIPGKGGSGLQRTYPIFRTEDNREWISLNGQTLVDISSLNLGEFTRRETVKR